MRARLKFGGRKFYACSFEIWREYSIHTLQIFLKK